ncbi:MAG: hypothetical protein ACTIKR_06950 [Advenella sp.]|uniref:hypothetical protein n=1 Tax=Advenella sp. TaxID=1872388 RepID=UPI003F9EA603
MRGRIWPFLLFIAALYFAASFGSLHAKVTQVQVVPPKPAGWILGDVVPVTIYIDSIGGTLQQSSLPEPGPLNYWLDLRSIDVAQSKSGEGTRYTLTLNYQTFYVPLDVNQREIPALDVLFSESSQSESVQIAPLVFYMSPLRGVAQSGTSVSEQIQPDAPAWQIGEKRLRAVATGLGLLALGLLLALAVHYAIWPFHRRRARPFAKAYRAIKKQARASDSESYRHSLIQLHRALDTCNEGRLLSSDVPDFVRQHPGLKPLQNEIELFFAASARTFFGNDQPVALTELTRSGLLRIAKQLATAERGGL